MSEAERAQVAGLILAAGRSRRMGEPKQLLPWPPKDNHHDRSHATLVTAAFDAVARVCDRMFVVLGAESDAVRAVLGGRSFIAVMGDSRADMSASIATGLRAILAAGPKIRLVVLQPGDHPGVSPTTLVELLERWRQSPDHAIMPEYARKGGHPVLVPATMIERMVRWLDERPEGGLRRFWEEHPDIRVRLPVNDAMCTLDFDTAEEYRLATLRFLAT